MRSGLILSGTDQNSGGAPLSAKGYQLGHAIEARIYAEDPENELLPSPAGFILREPALDHVRIESAAARHGISLTMIR
jgi:acetyl/propionyl-CoA carboxylase alpha subunit